MRRRDDALPGAPTGTRPGILLASCLAMAVLLGESTAATRSSPFPPPDPDDHTFVTDDAAFLDTDCLYRTSGPIEFEILITRFVGAVDGDGALRDRDALIANGVVSETATLLLPVLDVDFDADVDDPEQPERDVVSVNGHALGFLTGADGVWKLNAFEIPIELLRLPPRGDTGSTPDLALNTVRIDIDVANSRELWCTSVDWGLITFKALSPVVMIHGNGSDGSFFERQGLKGLLDALRIPNDNSISMVTAPITTHAAELDRLLPPIVETFGVDSVHLVAHSKGGLDTREWLATYSAAHDFTILTLSTLSTPHRGSVGADVLIAQTQASWIEGGGLTTDLLSRIMSPDAGTPDLTTWATAAFNADNVPFLPPEIVYRAVGADADQNQNGRIDAVPDEFAASRVESSQLRTIYAVSERLAANAIDAAYQIIRNSASVTVVTRERTVLGFPVLTYSVGVVNPGGDLNDTLVPLSSAAGPGFTFLPPFVAAEGRDHASIADGGVGATIAAHIRFSEETIGDFR